METPTTPTTATTATIPNYKWVKVLAAAVVLICVVLFIMFLTGYWKEPEPETIKKDPTIKVVSRPSATASGG